MLIVIALGVWLLLHASEGTPTGRVLHRWLVERPAARLSRISRGQVLLMLTLAVMVVTIIWLLEDDGPALVAFGLPDIAGLAVAIDLGTLLDVALVAVVAFSTVRVRAAGRWIAARLAPRRPRRRSIRIRRTTRPANDDEDRWALAA
ncbi:MAG: hypothetical protein J0I47_13485 [Sphingomonas sp.]|uniref:hypothetical protein n=1 Tax=Sphingomonas sp. TaxID=28214 RepID=UPI001AC5CE3D|nr:hypothetical protein [Sphingomonas sp.]MBN8809232.1 hypothetical protein [Sphingomonas sp.]